MAERGEYFRLFPEAVHVGGPRQGALYLLVPRRLFSLAPVYDRVLEQTEKNVPFSRVTAGEKISRQELFAFLDQLVEVEAGCYLDRPAFVEPIRPLNPVEDITLFRPAPVCRQLDIALTRECSQRCSFCRPASGRSFRYVPCLGCWKQGRAEGRLLDEPLLAKALDQAADLGCSTLFVHAGDTAFDQERIVTALRLADEKGYATIELITGSPLSPWMCEHLSNHRVTPVFQVLSHQAERHDQVCGVQGAFEQILENLHDLSSRHAPFKLIYVHTGCDASPRRSMEALLQLGPRAVIGDWLVSGTAGGEAAFAADFFVPPDIDTFLLQKKGQLCKTGRIALGADGNIYPCMPGDAQLLGNIGSHSLQQLLAEGVIQRHWYGEERASRCGRCELRFACTRCPLAAKELPPSLPFCDQDFSEGLR